MEEYSEEKDARNKQWTKEGKIWWERTRRRDRELIAVTLQMWKEERKKEVDMKKNVKKIRKTKRKEKLKNQTIKNYESEDILKNSKQERGSM